MTKNFASTAFLCLCIFNVALVANGQKMDAEGNQLIEAPFTGAPPTIDGVLSPGEWSAAESNTVDYINLGVAGPGGPGDTDGPDDMSFTFSVMYDDNFLYIGIDVKDDAFISKNYGQRLMWDLPVTWENDAVEYFFDGDLSRTDSGIRNPQESLTGGQWMYIIDSDEAPLPWVTPELYGETERPYGLGADNVWYAQTSATEGAANWSQEARFALSIIGNPQPGGEIGFNIGIDDVDRYDEATLTTESLINMREIQLFWTSFSYLPGEYCEEEIHTMETLWGSLVFMERTHVLEWPLF